MYISRQRGFSLIEIVLVIGLMAIIGGVGWYAWSKRHEAAKSTKVNVVAPPTTAPKTPSPPVPDIPIIWQAASEQTGWQPPLHTTPPKCPANLLPISPMDSALATGILVPGQYRGVHYKAHGGMGVANKNTTVRLPMEARLATASRYIESGYVQYLLSFQHACGIMVRFDHLQTLSDEFMAIMNTLPEPKVDDTRDLPLKDHPSFKAGTVVATAVGNPSMPHNIGFDFGVYDLRAPNQISKNSTWAALHRNEFGQNFYGLCWVGMLPSQDSARMKQLLAKLPQGYKGSSDYCTDAPGGSTLQYNNGHAIP